MKKKIYRFIFTNILGWKLLGNRMPINKCVYIVIPHTSWHDFYLGLLVRGILGFEINYVGKKELFVFPFGWFFRWMGGRPLDRRGNMNKVDAISALFHENKVFRLGIAPEGTRKKVTSLKTGFYYIALKGNAAIIPVAFDYGSREVRIGEPFYPTGDIKADLEILGKFFEGTIGKIPEYSFPF